MRPGEIIVDSFAGGGGASLGISWALGRSPDVAINHDREAIALHAANHPDSLHLSEDIWQVDPVKVCRGRPVGLMWLSPDCKHFSKAKGGKPVSKKIRGLAWVAVRWAAAVRPRVIVLENVEEFQTWGPVLVETGRPCPERKGKTFRAFIRRLQRLGYVVEWRELRACDYGAPTIRKRLFLIARCDGQPIVWPEPTHGKGRAHPWRTAAECIDWSLPCPSIFERKKPLAENTLKRIARGLRRFVIESADPFIVTYYGAKREGDDRIASLNDPLPTQPTENRFGLVTPFIAPVSHAGDSRVHPIDEPLRTITGSSRSTHALIAPYIAGVGGRQGQSPERPLTKPVQTITAKGDSALIAPVLVPRYGERQGQEPRSRSVQEPLPTVVPTQNGAQLVSAFLAKHYSERKEGEVMGSSLAAPAPTVTTIDHNALVTSNLINLRGTQDSQLAGRDVRQPLPTISGGGIHAAEVRAFLIAYYGNEKDGGSLRDPMRTVTSKDRLGLVMVKNVAYLIVDIGMRMLAPRELYRAQGFPDSYLIEIMYRGKPLTKTAQVRMVGNSVSPYVAKALAAANIGSEVEQVAA